MREIEPDSTPSKPLAGEHDQGVLLAELQRARRRLADQLRNAGHILDSHERQRRGIADRLHEEAAQTMAAALLAVGLLERGAAGELPQSQLEQVRRSVRDCIVNLRELAGSLRPACLEELGLLAALERISELERERASRSITFSSQDLSGRLPAEVEASSYRVIEELLNALSGVLAVHVTLAVEGGRLRVVLASGDHGASTHMAIDDELDRRLTTARAHLELLGGTLLVTSGTDDGVRLVADIPLSLDAALVEDSFLAGRHRAENH